MHSANTLNMHGIVLLKIKIINMSASIFIYKDEDGELVLDKNTGNINLTLASEVTRIRKIGCIAKNKVDGSLSYYKEEKEKDVYRKKDAWSINYNILKFLPADESTINIKTEKYIYRITKKKALEVGSFLYFKKSGIELKFYVNRDFFIKEDL